MQGKNMFRDLTAEEIECRIAQATEKGVSLLLYKDARCDMNILDETVGPMNWQRQHTRDNANCIVSIWDKEKQQWVSKEDTGTESNTEKEKGLASDSFKRSCTNFGIGRELYTAPFIWINADDLKTLKSTKDTKTGKDKWQCKDNFEVSDIEIKDKKITGLTIKNTTTKNVCFTFGNTNAQKPKKAEIKELFVCEICGKPFKPFEYKGKKYTAEQAYKYAKENRGAAICKECYETQKEQ